MCPDPYFWFHSINDYEYNDLKKSEVVSLEEEDT